MINFNSPVTVAALIIAVLIIIYFLKPKQRQTEPEGEDIKEKQVAVSEVEISDSEEDVELVAAIMGALSAYLDMPASKLRIKSIKRVDGIASTWRTESMREI